jgi:hypothetical protein
MLVYVDDIILISSSSAAADRLVISLSSDFAVKDLGKCNIPSFYQILDKKLFYLH